MPEVWQPECADYRPFGIVPDFVLPVRGLPPDVSRSGSLTTRPAFARREARAAITVPVSPIVRILSRQQAAGFDDLRGADVSATVPISEPLLNDLIQEFLPRSIPVRDLHVAPQPGDRFLVRARLGSSSLLPPLKLTVVIDRQPDLPTSPVLGLRLEMGALMSLAAPALRFLDALPAGVRLDRDRIFVDIATLLERRGFGRYLEYLHALELHTTNGAVVATIRGGVPQR